MEVDDIVAFLEDPSWDIRDYHAYIDAKKRLPWLTITRVPNPATTRIFGDLGQVDVKMEAETEGEEACYRSTEVAGADRGATDESGCERHLVPCPKGGCAEEESVPLDEVIEHLAWEHGIAAGKKQDHEIITSYLWRRRFFYPESGDLDWEIRAYQLRVGWCLPGVSVRGGRAYFFLQLVADSSVTQELRCQISLGTAVNVVSHVYPIDWTRDRIIADGSCFWLDEELVDKILDQEDVTDAERNNGFVGRLRVQFKLTMRTC